MPGGNAGASVAGGHGGVCNLTLTTTPEGQIQVDG